MMGLSFISPGEATWKKKTISDEPEQTTVEIRLSSCFGRGVLQDRRLEDKIPRFYTNSCLGIFFAKSAKMHTCHRGKNSRWTVLQTKKLKTVKQVHCQLTAKAEERNTLE